MAPSSWTTTTEEMIGREFTGAYRHFYPKCTTALRLDAVIAERFDSLPITFDDLPTPTVQNVLRAHCEIRVDDPALDELISDARHCAEGGVCPRDLPHLFGLVASARATRPHLRKSKKPRPSRSASRCNRSRRRTSATGTATCRPSSTAIPGGEPFYDNMTGYCGALPTPDGRGFEPGGATLMQPRREVARSDRETKARPE